MQSAEETKKREALPRAYACPFRENHYCKNCELFDINLNACVFKAINLNLGRIATGNIKLGEEKEDKN
ncbi:MAG: hypothetical protein DRO96_01455 [Candidatus Aenigmatarchaeota archaeon]|nr:MAG: hypothetical protein DRO96_01455 [Candidatus Aenigmarchaeota archaeon]